MIWSYDQISSQNDKLACWFIPSVSGYHLLSVNYHTGGYEVSYHCVENDSLHMIINQKVVHVWIWTSDIFTHLEILNINIKFAHIVELQLFVAICRKAKLKGRGTADSETVKRFRHHAARKTRPIITFPISLRRIDLGVLWKLWNSRSLHWNPMKFHGNSKKNNRESQVDVTKCYMPNHHQL